MHTVKTILLSWKSSYWVNMNANIKDMINNCLTCLDFHATRPKNKTVSHEIPRRLWESVRAGSFSINNKEYLCTVDYHSKFLVIKQLQGFSADNLTKTCKIIFTEYELSGKIVSDVGTNFARLNTSATDSAYIMQCHHSITMKAMDRQRHAVLEIFALCSTNHSKCCEEWFILTSINSIVGI